jgi:hypothetical protein
MTIEYGGFTVGQGTARQIDSYTIVDDGYAVAAFEFVFVTTSDTLSTEAAACEAAFRKPRQDLVVKDGAATLLSLKQSDDTGFDADPTITKEGHVADTAKSRRYRVRITFGRPADNVGTAGRRESNIDVNYDASNVRTVTITGTWTAVSGTGAFDGFTNNIVAYFNSVTSGIDNTATWEMIEKPRVERGETDKELDFTVVGKEVIYNQTVADLDDSDLVDPTITVTKEREAPGDSVAGALIVAGGGGVQFVGAGAGLSRPTVTVGPGGSSAPQTATRGRPYIVNAQYTANVDKAQTKDLDTLWTNKIRPRMIASIKEYADTQKVVILSSAPSWGPYENIVMGQIKAIVYINKILQSRITVEDSVSTGRVLHGVWSGDVYDYYEHQGHATRLRKVTEEYIQNINESDPHNLVQSLVADVGSSFTGFNEDEWMFVNRTPTGIIVQQGLGDDGTSKAYIATVTIQTVLQFRRRRKAQLANAGGLLKDAVRLTMT